MSWTNSSRPIALVIIFRISLGKVIPSIIISGAGVMYLPYESTHAFSSSVTMPVVEGFFSVTILRAMLSKHPTSA